MFRVQGCIYLAQGSHVHLISADSARQTSSNTAEYSNIISNMITCSRNNLMQIIIVIC